MFIIFLYTYLSIIHQSICTYFPSLSFFLRLTIQNMFDRNEYDHSGKSGCVWMYLEVKSGFPSLHKQRGLLLQVQRVGYLLLLERVAELWIG